MAYHVKQSLDEGANSAAFIDLTVLPT